MNSGRSTDRPVATAIELRGVSRSFGGLKAVDDVNLRVQAGTRHVLIGPNGAGKTTLFALMSGELEVSSGHVSLFGQDVTSWTAMRRSRAGMGRTYQITNVFAGLSVQENLVLAMRGRQGEHAAGNQTGCRRQCTH
jgi:branched-chain amino acid transport system ATP-binding protein